MFRNLSILLRALVGSSFMKYQLFESFREWVAITRRRKGSKKRSGYSILKNARVPCGSDDCRKAAAGEIISCIEPLNEFNAKQRSPEASWFNIKQLTEPQLTAGELISTRPI